VLSSYVVGEVIYPPSYLRFLLTSSNQIQLQHRRKWISNFDRGKSCKTPQAQAFPSDHSDALTPKFPFLALAVTTWATHPMTKLRFALFKKLFRINSRAARPNSRFLPHRCPEDAGNPTLHVLHITRVAEFCRPAPLTVGAGWCPTHSRSSLRESIELNVNLKKQENRTVYKIVYSGVRVKPEMQFILLKRLVGERGFEPPTGGYSEASDVCFGQRVYMGRDSQMLMVQLWWGGRSCIVETSGPPDTRAYESCTGPRRSHTPPHACDLFTLKQIFGSLWFATCPCPKHTSLASE